MKLKSAFGRATSYLRLSRVLAARNAHPTLHLAELLASVRLSRLPTVELRSVLAELRGGAEPNPNGNERVALHPLLTGGGSGSVGEMAALASITAAKRPKVVLEFGTYIGCSTWHLWANAAPDAQILTLDLPSHTKVEGSTDAGLQGVTSRPFLPDDPRVRLLEIDSREWAPAFPSVDGRDAGVDLCFIDAGHSYECVRNDTEKALSLMNRGGVILWHDATWRRDDYAVNTYLHDLRRQGRDVRLLDLGPFEYCALAVLTLP